MSGRKPWGIRASGWTLLFLTALAGLVPARPASADPGWMDAQWPYRRALTLDNSAGVYEFTNYAFTVTLPYFTGMKPDFGDVRFTDQDGTTPIGHWRERYNASSATFYVKVPSVPAWTHKTFYVYYGNPAAQTASDGAATFDFFDDFLYPNGTVPASWAASGAAMVADNGTLKITTAGAGWVYTKNYATTNGIVEARVSRLRGYSYNLTARTDPAAKLDVGTGPAGVPQNLYLFEHTPQTGLPHQVPFTYGSGYSMFKLFLAGPSLWGKVWDVAAPEPADWNVGGRTGNVNAGAVGFYVGNTDCRVDWLRVRRYSPYEPPVYFGEPYFRFPTKARFESLDGLTSADVAAIRADASKMAAVFAKCKTELSTDLGFTLSDPELYAVFCTLVSNRMAPYGPSSAHDLAALLKEPKMDCDNYMMLAGFLNQQYGAPVPMRYLGWNGGPVGNHVQIMGNDRLLLDPTLALVAVTGFQDLTTGKPVNTVILFSHNESLKVFCDTVVDALVKGKYRANQVVYSFTSPQAYVAAYF
jgi:hypothetical protein